MTVSPRAPDPDDDALGDALPRPPPLEDIATTGVWIVQWRDGRGPQPGTALHRWLEDRHPGWARLVMPGPHRRGLGDQASWFARDARASPILHQTRTATRRARRPERDGGCGRPAETHWPHTGALNLATRGNLLVCAAGDGVAARLAPPPPAIVTVIAPTMPARRRRAVADRDPAPYCCGARPAGPGGASAPLAPVAMQASRCPNSPRACGRRYSPPPARTARGPGNPAALMAALGTGADPTSRGPRCRGGCSGTGGRVHGRPPPRQPAPVRTT